MNGMFVVIGGDATGVSAASKARQGNADLARAPPFSPDRDPGLTAATVLGGEGDR